MTDRSNEPRTIIVAGLAMIVLALILVPVIWWLGVGVRAGMADQVRFENSPRPHRDVLLYTLMLQVIGLVLGIACAALATTGGVIVWKGIKKIGRRAGK